MTRRGFLGGALSLGSVALLAACGDNGVGGHLADPKDPGPYPPSEHRLRWDSISQIRTLPSLGDNWPATLGSDGNLYTAYGDGYGFGGDRLLSLGFARVAGTPFSGQMTGMNIRSNIDSTGGSRSGIKASGLIEDGGVLWCFVRNVVVNGTYRHSRLAWSGDKGETWAWAKWHFSGTFGCPDFVQYGPTGADPSYVYVVSQDNDDAYSYSPGVVLARVPRAKIADRRAWEFFSGTPASPAWSAHIGKRKPVLRDANGTLRVSMSYNAPLGRYLLVSSHGRGTTLTSALGVFGAPAPWGPWTTMYYSSSWSIGESYAQKFPPAFMSSDGKAMWLLFSGQEGSPYKFALRRAIVA